MNTIPTSDVRVSSFKPVASPRELLAQLPASQKSLETVSDSRRVVADILEGRDKRLLAIVGPCSIHDEAAAFDYAERLLELRKDLEDQMYIIMRVYFEKPRTKLGWKGLILDPALDGSHDISNGLRRARSILGGITSRGMPAGSEALDPIVPQYIDDLVSWAAIGARTTESQTHREMASGLSMAVGFKNGTDGSVDIAVNAMASSCAPHHFIGIDADGRTAIVQTKGNELGHIILRGGKNGPNYYREKIEDTASQLAQAGLPQRVVIDCSHANANKDFRRQSLVLEEAIRYRCSGIESIKGFMLESNLVEGRQDIPKDLSKLVYGMSVTDSCIGWDETARVMRAAAKQLRTRV